MKTDPFSLGGEFLAPADEAEYRTERIPERTRQVRLLFRYALFTNLLFYLNDLRFYGQRHFVWAMAARTGIVAASAAGLAALPKVEGFRQLQGLCLAWTAPVIVAGAILVSPHTDVALFITCILPVVFYLGLPVGFAATLACGLAGSTALLTGYMASAPLTRTSLGLGIAMLTINLFWILVVTRANRLHRLEWSATRTAHAAGKDAADQREMLQNLLKAIPTPLLILAQGSRHVIQANDAARRYFGAQALGEDQSLETFLDPKDLERLTATLRSTGHVTDLELPLRFPDGRRRDVLLAVKVARMGDTGATLAVLVDITRRKEMEAQLKRLATTDPLTGLVNRTRFFAAASAEIRRTRRHGGALAVIMVDIDLFKRINDAHGHQMGDLALRSFADLCRTSVRETDIVARLGGEEFALLLPETEWADALALAERLRAAVEALRIGKGRLAMTISLGLAQVLPGESTVDPALSRADQALYEAKRAGRNRVVRYAPPATENRMAGC